jgi:hypothetical protein
MTHHASRCEQGRGARHGHVKALVLVTAYFRHFGDYLSVGVRLSRHDRCWVWGCSRCVRVLVFIIAVYSVVGLNE